MLLEEKLLLWHTFAYSGILWNTLAYSHILWHTLACSGILWHNQCIINNCWRSVPLPCGQYMAIFAMRTALVSLMRTLTLMALNGCLEYSLSFIWIIILYLILLFKLNEECEQYIRWEHWPWWRWMAALKFR